MPVPRKRSWQLPEGVSRGTWDYIHSEHIASDYDRYFASSAVMRLDLEMLTQHLPASGAVNPATIADLGCGTGRVARALLPQGYRVVSVDLSEAMLSELTNNIPDNWQDQHTALCANLVDIADHLDSSSIDMAVCLFSTLGMIRGRGARRKFLRGVRRILRPGAPFFLHVHNRYRNLFDPAGPKWLLGSWLNSLYGHEHEFGDRVYSYRGLPSMFLHIYGQRELRADLRDSGFTETSILAINSTGEQLLRRPRWIPSLRAGGFFAIAS